MIICSFYFDPMPEESPPLRIKIINNSILPVATFSGHLILISQNYVN